MVNANRFDILKQNKKVIITKNETIKVKKLESWFIV